MFALLIRVLFSVAFATLVKTFVQQGRQRSVVLAGNYFMAALISGGIWLAERESVHVSPTHTILLGAINGALFVGGFLLNMQTMHKHGMAVTVSLIRLSVALPVLASILFFGERLTRLNLLAVFLSAVAVLLLAGKGEGAGELSRFRQRWVALASPIGLFLCNGVGDIVLKLFEQTAATKDRGFFLCTIFTAAFLLSAAVVLVRRVRPRPGDVLAGLGLGIPNQFANLFMVIALQTVPAAIAFPIANISVMILSTFVGVVIWREKLGRRGWLGILLALVAVALLVR
jgi:drug/metabolite transporter (DMT)-like permease